MEEFQTLRLERGSYDVIEDNKYLSIKALEERSKHKRQEQLLLPKIVSLIQDIETELK